MRNIAFPIIVVILLFANSFAAGKDLPGTQNGTVIIRSVPLKCEVTFLDKKIIKTKDHITVKDVPVGKHSISFSFDGKIANGEVDVQSGTTLVAMGHLRRNRVLVTPNIFVGKDDAPMVLIPAGEFQMGSIEGEDDEIPVHTVSLNAFYIDIYEVTNAQYKKFMDAAGYKPPRYWDDSKYNAPDQPVVGVTFADAKAYCEWAGKRLPTEAEWEKAARGGLAGKTYPWGDDVAYDGMDDATGGSQGATAGTSPVGSIAPNGYGLHDVAGNAWEWCSDWYGEDYYEESPKENPTGPASGENRVMRGGSWAASFYAPLRAAYRYSFDPTNTSDLIGLRCAASRD